MLVIIAYQSFVCIEIVWCNASIVRTVLMRCMLITLHMLYHYLSQSDTRKVRMCWFGDIVMHKCVPVEMGLYPI